MTEREYHATQRANAAMNRLSEVLSGLPHHRLHVPSPVFDRSGVWQGPGRIEADLLHYCSAACFAAFTGRGDVELARRNIEGARCVLREIEEYLGKVEKSRERLRAEGKPASFFEEFPTTEES